jgi:uncharacterized protein with HEPN domain
MPMGNVRERVQRMLDAVNGLERNLAGKSFEEFAADPDLAAAVERYVERLSAALGHAPQSMQENHPNVDWQAIGSIGNLLRHIYDRSLDRQVWDIAKSNLPELKRAVSATIRAIDAG